MALNCEYAFIGIHTVHCVIILIENYFAKIEKLRLNMRLKFLHVEHNLSNENEAAAQSLMWSLYF